MDTADGAVVLVELVDQGSHAVVPKLDNAAVETGKDPWALGVEAQALHSVTLGLEFGQHVGKSVMQLGFGMVGCEIREEEEEEE